MKTKHTLHLRSDTMSASTRPFSAGPGLNLLLVLLAFLGIVCDSSAVTFNDSGFASELVATLPTFGPVGVAWAPDGRLFVWQKNGIVRIVKNGTLLATPFLDFSAKVNTYNDNGMLGFAFDPDFANNRYIFMTYIYEPGGDPNSTGTKMGRLVRVTASAASPDVMLAGSETIILDNFPVDYGTHVLGTIRFASDGTMFFGNGDGSDPGGVDLNAAGAQELTSVRGKIFRINRDGTAANDNPFYDGTDSIQSKVWCYGVRNPYRFSLHPLTGAPYFADVGWNTWEEIDKGVRGGNFGWPCYEGIDPQPLYQGVLSQCPQTSSVIAPIRTYNHSVGDLNAGGTCIVGGDFYTGTVYPQAYQGNYFYADYSGNWIHRLVLDVNGNVASVASFATSAPAVTCIEQGPDGLLYYVSIVTGEVRRIRYNGPVAVASATPSHGYSPLPVLFSSGGSVNPGGGSLSYLWDFGDGTTSSAANPSHTYVRSGVGSYTARLTVTSGALSSSATVVITVGSMPPSPVISIPVDGSGFMPGQTVTYQGSAIDPDEGALGASALVWTVLLHHNTHVHTFVEGAGTGGNFVAESHGTVGTFYYEIVLKATDSSGLAASSGVNVAILQDGIPPTAPTGLLASAAATTQIDLNWSPSTDNAAVNAYSVERCEGAGCNSFTPVTTVSGTTYSDTGLLPQTAYSYRVRAIDASGNYSDYSGLTSSTTLTPPPVDPSLVAAYSFNEGTGTAAVDSSGKGNSGILAGATWATAGKYGNALSFNGSSSRVTINDAASLRLTGGMTLEAWVRPTVVSSGWRDIIYKGDDNYYLMATTTSSSRPAFGGIFGSTYGEVFGVTALTVNTWTHLAGTYDGATEKLYMNGVQVATRPQTGNIVISTNPLQIGSDSFYGQYFSGMIDEVRLYNRALSASEIQTDMNTPIGGAPAPDAQAPSTPSGLGATAVSSSQINVSWTASTDNVGVTVYLVERSQGAGSTSFTQVGTPSGTTFNDTALAPGTLYNYRARATDAAGNLSGYSNTSSATTQAASDTQAPTVPSGLGSAAVSSSQISLSWTASTDNVGVTGYLVERSQGAGSTGFTQVGTPSDNTFNDTGLAASTVYNYRVRARDVAGNLSGYSTTSSATTQSSVDTQAPTAPSGLGATAASSSQVNLTWTLSTDNVAVTSYLVERSQGSGSTSFTQVGTPAATSFNDSGLAASTVYNYRVTARDAAGNLSAYSSTASGTTFAGSGSIGLVAAYSFNEGVGTTVTDLSGNGNGGTLSAATWTTSGKYGKALSFNGTSSRVTINDAGSLHLTAGMTLEAWVRPSTVTSAWKDVIYKGDDNYYLMATTTNGKKPALGAIYGSTYGEVFGTSALTANTWIHLSGTYDGGTERLYVNGVQVASRAQTGNIVTSTNPLQIGSDSFYGQYFNGIIDEVRIYNRALSAAEIQTDMNTPLSP